MVIVEPAPYVHPEVKVYYEARMITQIIRKQFFCVTDVCVIGKLISR